MSTLRVGSGGHKIVPFPPNHKAIDIGDYYADYTRIRTTLGWEPKVVLREGLERTVSFYRENRAHYW